MRNSGKQLWLCASDSSDLFAQSHFEWTFKSCLDVNTLAASKGSMFSAAAAYFDAHRSLHLPVWCRTLFNKPASDTCTLDLICFLFCCSWETLLNGLPFSFDVVVYISISLRNSQPRCSETLECEDVCRLRNERFFISFVSNSQQSAPSEFKTGPSAALLLQHSSTPNDCLSAVVCTLSRLQPVRGDDSCRAARACFLHALCQCRQTDAASY